MDTLELITREFSSFLWGIPLLILLLGGGTYFLLYSRLLPFKYFTHAIKILSGKYDDPNEPGDINHFQALSTALAATVGMGNISGVAVAIVVGGPGAILWMWLSAICGTATKFFTCTLAIMYRGRDDKGDLQGGPMYFITEGLGKKWRPLAVFFCLSCMIGVLPVFQANQLNQAIHEVVLQQFNIERHFTSSFLVGLTVLFIASLVVIGGIKRIAKTTSRMVPVMVALYFLMVIIVLVRFHQNIIPSFILIFHDAFSGNAVLGGALGTLIITGIKRGTFSNEAGLGTAPLAHGAAKTSEPVREGLVAMLGPMIDTLIVCTLTALTIIVTGVWKSGDENGIALTMEAMEVGIPGIGSYLLGLCVLFFSLSTMFAYPYYGSKCFSFVFGTKYANSYLWFYLFTIVFGSVVSLNVVINLIDGVFALMAIPTVISAIILSPKVKQEAIKYFGKL